MVSLLALWNIYSTGLAHGCPPQAIVATYGVDERTVADWQQAAGTHCRKVHEAVVQQGQLDLQQVQVDEIRVKAQGQIVWMALAIAVTTRLWLGGVLRTTRDMKMAVALAWQVKACASFRPLLVCFDGFVAYLQAFRRVFRTPLREGQIGRPPCGIVPIPQGPHLIPWPNLALGQVIKQYARRRVVGIERRILQGGEALVQSLIAVSQGRGVLNTAYIERLQATFRSRLACLIRRGRSLARTVKTLEAGMYLVGCVYNFCTWHEGLRLPLYISEGRRERRHWVRRTPAMAAGLTDHRWTVLELLSFKVPPPPYTLPKRRGRPPKVAVLAQAA